MDLCEFEVSPGYAVRPCFKKIPPPVSTTLPANSLTPLKCLWYRRLNCILGKQSPLSSIPWKSAFVGRVLSSSLPINPPGCGHLFGYA